MSNNDRFVWGVATSAHQIEGGRHEGGKSDSIWDHFADEGRVPDVDMVGCDHYHRWEEDLDLLSNLGVSAYRFSISWARVLPEGVGRVNAEGLRFYRRLMAGLVDRGIDPYPTLYHWDLPQAQQDKGGWMSRSTASAFAEYARIVVGELGDLSRHWITHNEPWVATMLGHLEGVFAPGLADWEKALAAGHHILLSHGQALEAIRQVHPRAEIGLALDCRPAAPASSDQADLAATRHFDGFRNRWFFDPIFGKGYPADMVGAYQNRGRLPGGLEAFVLPGDLDVISQPIDFLGLNYYTTIDISVGGEESEVTDVPPGAPARPNHTEMGWRIDPAGLEGFLLRVHETYGPRSIMITENGASYSDGPDEGGSIRDERRISYLDAHIDAVMRARAAGVPVQGYFVWSLLDNLEWTQGFSQRFGLVWVDHENALRLPKDSFHWYSRRIASGWVN